MPPRPLMTIVLTPTAREDLTRLQEAQKRAALKALQTIQSLDWVGLWAHNGLNFEKLSGLIEPTTASQLYSFRFGKAARAICTIEDDSVVLVATFHTDHDKAYRSV